MNEVVLVTGAAGFIGSHLVEHLLELGYRVVGLDNFNDYYSPTIKRNNLRAVEADNRFIMVQGDIRDAALITKVFSENNISLVAHLAARAGVRPSLTQALLYEDVNVRGTINLLEASRNFGVKQFIFASSSSVYGLDNNGPFHENQKVDCPTSPYAASKAAAELYCRAYSYLYGLRVVVLRLFTVYGPRQRPDMAISLFTRMIDSGEEVPVFGDGTSKRDYTYISDIVDGTIQAFQYQGDAFEIFNLGDSRPVVLEHLIKLIEESLGKKARIKRLPTQLGDVPITFAAISKAEAQLNYRPKIKIEEGVASFIKWYRESGGGGRDTYNMGR